MTIKDVRAKVAAISVHAGDDETAHGAEDDLYEAVLREVAKIDVVYGDRSRELAAMARAALRTKRIKFRRDCA